MEIVVSIIIPLYNSERSIRRCLDSIFSLKTNHSFEVITLTGPCTDKTLEIIEEYEAKYTNLRNYNVSWRSAALSRSKGIEESHGKYLMFIDGDDYYREDALEVMVNTLENNDADIVTSSYYYVRGKKISKNFFSKNHTYDRKGMLKALMQDSYMHGFMWNKIYKRELLVGKKFIMPKNNIIREDLLLNFQVFLNANKLVMISKPIYYYDKTYESTTSGKDLTRIPWFVTVFAVERYLLEKYEPSYMKMYRSLNNRRKLLIWGDEVIMKKFYEKKEFNKFKKEMKNALKVLNKKGSLQIEGMPWEEFLTNNK